MSKTEEQVIAEIAAVIREVDEDLQSISDSDVIGKTLSQDLGLDSLDAIKFFLLLEEKYGYKVPDADIDSHALMEVNNLVAYLVAHA